VHDNTRWQMPGLVHRCRLCSLLSKKLVLAYNLGDYFSDDNFARSEECLDELGLL